MNQKTITNNDYQQFIQQHKIGTQYHLMINNKNIDTYSMEEFKLLLKQFKQIKRKLLLIKISYTIIYFFVLLIGISIILSLSVFIPYAYTKIMLTNNQGSTADIMIAGSIFFLLILTNGFAYLCQRYKLEYHIKKILVHLFNRHKSNLFDQYVQDFDSKAYIKLKMNQSTSKKIKFLKKYIFHKNIRFKQFLHYFN